MIQAVIFDMDGVLIDARDWHYEALNRALAIVGYGISRFDHLHTYDGLPTRRKLEMLSLEQGLPRGLHGFINELKQTYTMELIGARCKPTFQHEYALAKLRHEGYKLGVASNSVRQSVVSMMERSGLSIYLDVLLSNEDIVSPKPDPEIYVKAMETLDVPPNETLIVEDNPHGVEAAQRSGAHVLVVADPVDVTHDLIVRRIRQIEDHTSRAGEPR